MSRWFVGLLLALLLPSYAAAALCQAMPAPVLEAATTEACAALSAASCEDDDPFEDLPDTVAHDAASDLPELFAHLPDQAAPGRRSDTPPLAPRTQAPTPFLEGLMRPPCAA